MASSKIRGSSPINSGDTKGMLAGAKGGSANASATAPQAGPVMRGMIDGGGTGGGDTLQGALSPKVAVNGRMPAGDVSNQSVQGQQSIFPREVVPGVGKGARGQSFKPGMGGKVR